MNKSFVTAIVLAAGSGTRMGTSLTKQRMKILGETVLHRSVRAMDECDDIDAIIVTVRSDEIDFASRELKNGFRKTVKIISGGKSRGESARLAFSEIPDGTDFVAIHDAARCLITKEMISGVINAAKVQGAATAVSHVTDTVKHKDSSGLIDYTLDRENLYFASTPQVFCVDLYREALKSFNDTDFLTDDNMLIEKIGKRIAPVNVGCGNIKITTMEDIDYAEFLLMKRNAEKMGHIRVGHGYDVHRFTENRQLILGGVEIPYDKGLLGHSDADVLTHAIMDALLGACSLGDIGRHFPDTAEEYDGISSILLLKKVCELISEKGYQVVNIDATLILQKPKIAPFIDEMIVAVASAVNIDTESVNIKATTEEKLGFTGSGEGAAAHAVALVEKK